MQFNTTQYYLISPISRVEEFIEELENYRQINKDLPSQNSKQAVFIIILSKIKQKKKRKILSNVCNPVFHSVKVASPLAKLYHPLYSSDETVTLVLHSIPTTVSSRSRLINQRTTRAIRETVGELVDVTRARAHTQRLARIDSYRSVDKLGSILLAIRKHLLELGFGDWPPRCLRQTLQLNIREWRVELRD